MSGRTGEVGSGAHLTRRILSLAVASFYLSAASPCVLAAPPAHAVWAPIPAYTDEFNGTELDRNKWLNYHPYWSGRDTSYFVEENVSVRDGNLQLQCTLGDPDAKRWIKAACVASDRAAAHYGYYEARIKASAISMTTSFWFQGKRSEIDVIENIGQTTKEGNEGVEWRMNMNAHYKPRGKSRQGNSAPRAYPRNWKMPSRARDGFHVYGLEWNEKKVRWYHDHQLVYEIDNAGQWIEPQYMFFDAEAFSWEGYPTQESLQDPTRNTFYIDWVRAWRKIR